MRPLPLVVTALAALGVALPALASPELWQREFPRTDFSRHSVPYAEIFSGGPPRDGIPSIDEPRFVPIAEAALADQEAVVGLVLGGEARAYPLQVLMWHEIVNDEIAGVPVAVTWCPLCNTSVVFDRRMGERVLSFGTTGRLRHSDLVMYDRETESWWQQFLGEAIIGELTGSMLDAIPSRLESFASFKARTQGGVVLVPNDPTRRAYGRNPYVGYDSANAPFLYRGEMPAGIHPMARVVRVGEEAWSLDLLRTLKVIEAGDLRLSWTPGQSSALDAGRVADGLDVGDVVVQRLGPDGWRDEVYMVDFAFAFHAFVPDGVLHR